MVLVFIYFAAYALKGLVGSSIAGMRGQGNRNRVKLK
jgi:hypothetical protein